MSTKDIDKLNIGSLNVGGMNKSWKKKYIETDLDKYDLNILALQETKTEGTLQETITTRKGKTFVFFSSNSDKKNTMVLLFSLKAPSHQILEKYRTVCVWQR